MIFVYALNLSGISEEQYTFFYQEASLEIREKADRCRFLENKKQKIFSERLLRLGLQQFGCTQQPEIAYNDFGKPYLKNVDGFFYNLSHSGDWAVIAWGSQEVGVDVEHVRETIELKRIANRFFSKEEQTYLFELSKKTECVTEGQKDSPDEKVLTKEEWKRFLKLWTAKESYVKYLGSGLAKELEQFWVDGWTETIHLCENRQLGRETQGKIILKNWQLQDAYWVTVCSGSKDVVLKEIFVKDLEDFS